jgi:hypothetical protein
VSKVQLQAEAQLIQAVGQQENPFRSLRNEDGKYMAIEETWMKWRDPVRRQT